MHLNVQTLSILLGSVTIMFCAGCYNPRTFRSDSADIRALDFWSSPRYRIMFDKMSITTSVTVEHEFSNPPAIEMNVCLDFHDANDLEMLYKHGGSAKVTLFDESNEVVFEAQDVLKPGVWHGDPDFRWQESGIVSRHPPPDWSQNSNGQVLCAGTVKLRRATYRIRIEIVVESPLPEPVIIHPLLAGGFRSVL